MKKFVDKFKSDKSAGSHGQQQQYAPPPGPPPSQGAGGSAQQYYQGGGSGGGGGYAPPPGPPPQGYGGGAPGGGQYGGALAGGYGGGPPPIPQGHPSGGAPAAGGEDPFSALRKYDTVVLVDDSGSMEMYWDETRDALQGVVAKAIQYDQDGIDLYFFNDTTVARNVNSVQEVKKVFRRIDPRRSTPTARALSRVLDPYLASLEQAKAAGPGGPKVKPLNLIVLTDGAPDRGQDPEPVLVAAGKRLDATRQPLFQLGVNFIQIGNDEDAAKHLASLDDDLKAKHKIRDFVDTVPFVASRGGHITSEFILKSLLGGINRRVDKEATPAGAA